MYEYRKEQHDCTNALARLKDPGIRNKNEDRNMKDMWIKYLV